MKKGVYGLFKLLNISYKRKNGQEWLINGTYACLNLESCMKVGYN